MSRDSFHDLHHENAVDPQHIRLISEGGICPVRSPQPVCIDSIQVSQTCTTESQHPVYRSTTGAHRIFSTSDNALFSISSEHADELDRQLLPEVLRVRFAQQGIQLSASARLAVHRAGRIWYISDDTGRYSVRKLAAYLTVYRDSE